MNDDAKQFLAKKTQEMLSHNESMLSGRSNNSRHTRRNKNALDPRALDNPQKVEEYLKTKKVDKDLDMGFLDRKLLYTKNTIHESTQQLKLKNDELDDIVKDLNFRENNRISMKSNRNTAEIKGYASSENESASFMGFIRNFFTCANGRS